jgi:heptosyltransferase-2
LDMLVRKGNQGLFDGHPYLNELLIWDKQNNKNRNLLALSRRIRNERYDHVINCQRFFSTGMLTAFSGANERIGYSKNPLSFLFDRTVPHHIGDGRHETDRLNDLVAHLTDGKAAFPALFPLESNRLKTKRSGTYVTIAPASVWHTKQWPPHKWIGLIELLPPLLEVLLIGGPSDKELCDRIKLEARRGEVLAGKLSLLDTAALMKGAEMNYVNDSAPLHIASAMRAPVTAVFCSTVPSFGFGPLGDNGKVVETTKELECRPCGLHGRNTCPLGHFNCAEQIEPDQVR